METKKLFLCMLFGILCSSANSQAAETKTGVSNLLKLNFLSPGVSYEQKIFIYQTLHLSTFMDIGISTLVTDDGNETDVYYLPFFNAQFRTYYNIPKLIRKGFDTSSNSGSYVAPVYFAGYSFSEEKTRHQVGAVWGVQRTAPKGFSIDVNVGVSYTFQQETYTPGNSAFNPILQIALGFKI